MQLQVPEFNARLFTYNPELKAICIDASEMGPIRNGHLYDDAADIGLAVRNFKSGGITRWNFAEEDKDREGDTICWVYHPTPETLHRYPHMEGWVLTVYND